MLTGTLSALNQGRIWTAEKGLGFTSTSADEHHGCYGRACSGTLGPPGESLAYYSIYRPTLTITEADHMAASGDIHLEPAFEPLFEHLSGTGFPNKAILRAVRDAETNDDVITLFNPISARALAHDYFDGQTVEGFSSLVLQRDVGILDIESSPSEIWLRILP